ncbi:putative RNA methyltransferase [Starmerella bacillaris]|uniref:RNA methyltransferase n=1 Tax=Starmerella bacillaris TaxID=1247836 RepID=A0AAV5RP71_STABA|nr:putative RNA methyltransferase [Starmerella bacillaris]
MFQRTRFAWQRIAASIEHSPKKRRMFHAGFLCLNLATLYGAVNYLRETKHRAIGGKQLPNKFEVKAHNTEPVYNSIAEDYDDRINREELMSYIWLMRKKVCKNLHGDCLEVSCGTMRNLPYISKYLRSNQIQSLTFVDPSEQMLAVGKQKFVDSDLSTKVPAQFVKGRAEDLGVLCESSNQKFDTVFETFGLCSHEDPVAALHAMADVLKPNGKIVLLEHGKGDWAMINNHLDRKAEKRAEEWGCRWNLDLDSIIEQSKLKVVQRKKYHFGTSKLYILEKE